uniref:Uncharacterized protein n=1 Tax=Anguilla anguilla TaxID=7936 RepID=A0A0E9QH67_ANGAN
MGTKKLPRLADMRSIATKKLLRHPSLVCVLYTVSYIYINSTQTKYNNRLAAIIPVITEM